jgi:nucleotide-binding universal stress UspA family protein
MIALKNILVATDFGDASATALAYGRDLARVFNATLHVATVVDNLMARSIVVSTYAGDLEGVQDRLESDAESRLRALVTDDDRARFAVKLHRITDLSPATALTEYAAQERIDLILMGTHGRRGMSRMLLGSVAERVVREAPCPVLVVRHPEHDFLQPDALVTVPASATSAATR